MVFTLCNLLLYLLIPMSLCFSGLAWLIHTHINLLVPAHFHCGLIVDRFTESYGTEMPQGVPCYSSHWNLSGMMHFSFPSTDIVMKLTLGQLTLLQSATMVAQCCPMAKLQKILWSLSFGIMHHSTQLNWWIRWWHKQTPIHIVFQNIKIFPNVKMLATSVELPLQWQRW